MGRNTEVVKVLETAYSAEWMRVARKVYTATTGDGRSCAGCAHGPAES